MSSSSKQHQQPRAAAMDPYTCIQAAPLQLWSDSPLLSLPHLGAAHTLTFDAQLSGLDKFRKAERNLLCELNSADVALQITGAHGLWVRGGRGERREEGARFHSRI